MTAVTTGLNRDENPAPDAVHPFSTALAGLTGLAADENQRGGSFQAGYCDFTGSNFFADYSQLVVAIGKLLPNKPKVTGYVQWSKSPTIVTYSSGLPCWTPPVAAESASASQANVLNNAELVAVTETATDLVVTVKVFPRSGGWQLAVTRTAIKTFGSVTPCIYDDLHYASGLGAFKTLTYRRIWLQQSATSALRPVAFALVGATAQQTANNQTPT